MNILMLTSVYKDESLGNEDKSTNIVNSFVHDWVKMGNRVFVVHNSHRYPIIVHKIPHQIKSKLAAKMGFYISDYNVVCKKHYEDGGAKVWRLPMMKVVPHKAHSRKMILRQTSIITKILKENDFIPEIIVGHWASPQMEIISELKKLYNCRTAIVLHGTGYIDRKDYPVHEYLKGIDKIGCRSKAQAEIVKNMLELKEAPFVCYSGVPDEYLRKFELNTNKFLDTSTWRFVYAGRLVKYKNIDTVIKALSELTIDWQLDIIGDGAEEDNLRSLCENLNCTDKVIFHGRTSRDRVMEKLSEAHCFVMVSKGEIFGLVYLEAMAATCITIGSTGEGIDGVILDGENGFLVEPGDVEKLVQKISGITSLKQDDLHRIGKESYNTAIRYSDSRMAEDYLGKVLS